MHYQKESHKRSVGKVLVMGEEGPMPKISMDSYVFITKPGLLFYNSSNLEIAQYV